MIEARSFIRQRGSVQAPGLDLAKALREALAANGVAEVFDDVTGAGSRLVFTLQARGIAVVVLTPDGQHLATYADPVAGVAHGFALLDHAAQHQRPAQPRPTRARRRTTEKETAR